MVLGEISNKVKGEFTQSEGKSYASDDISIITMERIEMYHTDRDAPAPAEQ